MTVFLPPTPSSSVTPSSSFSSPPPTKSSSLSLHMPQHLAQNANLATQVVPSDAPPWAIAHDAAHPQTNGHLEVMGSRTYHDIFHLPNLGGVIRKWLFTRPTIEAISEDSFSNSAVESMTLFRIERIDDVLRSLMITPTVSSHYMFIPCQTINGYTVGLAYLDTTYERDNLDDGIRDNRVPPLRLGRFVIDDSTGEIFCSAWIDNLMVIAWTQSIIKCERVHEYLLFEAPEDGSPPRNLLLRNSFFERRSCSLCGLGNSIINLPPPCSGVDNRRLSQDPCQQFPNMLTNVASIYRRFRGSYFGVVLKTRYGSDRQPQSQQLVPVFAQLKHGLHTVKVGFKNNLRKNIEIVLGAASNDGYFGLNPRSAAKSSLLLLKACTPVVSNCFDPTEDSSEISGLHKSKQSRKRRRSTSPHSVVNEGSIISNDGEINDLQDTSYSFENNESINSYDGKQQTTTATAVRRIRSEDPLQRDSIVHKRKVRNRISAQKSNKLRKMMLEQKKADLADLKVRLPKLQQRYEELQRENIVLKMKVFGDNPIDINDDCNNNSNNNNNSNSNLNFNNPTNNNSNSNLNGNFYNNTNNNNNNINTNNRSGDLDPVYVMNGGGSFDGVNNSFSGKVDLGIDVVDTNQIQMDWIDELKTESAIAVGDINNQSFD